MTHPEPRNTSDLKAAIRQSLELLDGNPTPKAAVLRTMLWTLKAQLTLETANYKRLERIEERINAMDITGLTNATNTLNGLAQPLSDAAAAITKAAGNLGSAATDQTQLDTAVATLGTAVTAIANGVTALQAAVTALTNAVTPPAPTPPTPPAQ